MLLVPSAITKQKKNEQFKTIQSNVNTAFYYRLLKYKMKKKKKRRKKITKPGQIQRVLRSRKQEEKKAMTGKLKKV